MHPVFNPMEMVNALIIGTFFVVSCFTRLVQLTKPRYRDRRYGVKRGRRGAR